MRTTITLEPDVEALVQKTMKSRGVTFKQVVSEALRQGLSALPKGPRFKTPTFSSGTPGISLDKALQIAGTLDDAELARKFDLRK